MENEFILAHSSRPHFITGGSQGRNLKQLVIAHPQPRVERSECVYVQFSASFLCSYVAQGSAPGDGATPGLQAGSPHIMSVKIIPARHAHRPTFSRQLLTEAVLLCDLRLCQVDKLITTQEMVYPRCMMCAQCPCPFLPTTDQTEFCTLKAKQQHTFPWKGWIH